MIASESARQMEWEHFARLIELPPASVYPHSCDQDGPVAGCWRCGDKPTMTRDEFAAFVLAEKRWVYSHRRAAKFVLGYLIILAAVLALWIML